MRTVYKLLVVMVAIVAAVTMTCTVYAESGIETSTSVDTEDFNLVLLIDRSGSMRTTDKSALVKDAAKLFIDLCDESSASKISVMSFNTGVNNSGFVTTDSEDNRTYLKNQIAAITYDNGSSGGTDLGLAVKSAMELLKAQGDPDKKNVIVLFTDGYTQDLIGGRTEAQSNADLTAALETAVEIDCRIYTIGVNYNGSMDAKGQAVLENLRAYQLGNAVPVIAVKRVPPIRLNNRQRAIREMSLRE